MNQTWIWEKNKSTIRDCSPRVCCRQTMQSACHQQTLAPGLRSGSAAEFAHIMIISKDNVKLPRCLCGEMSFCRMDVCVAFKNAAEKEIKLKKKKKRKKEPG